MRILTSIKGGDKKTGFYPGPQTATTSPRNVSPKKSGGGSTSDNSNTPKNPALANITPDARHTPASTVNVTPTTKSTTTTKGSATQRVQLTSTPALAGTPTTQFKAPAAQFRTSQGAEIIKGKPAGYAAQKNQMVGQLLQQQAEQKTKAYLNRPGPTGLGPGSVTPETPAYAPTPGGALDKATAALQRKAAQLEGQASTQRAQGKLGVLTAAKAGAVGLVSGAVGFAAAAAHPWRSLKGTYNAIRHPLQTGARAGEALSTRPVQTTTETIGQVAAAYGATKLVGKGIQQARKIKQPEIQSFQPQKTRIKTKQVAPGIDTIQKSTIEQSAKARVKVGNQQYAVKTTGRAKAITTETGRAVTVGNVKTGITTISKKGVNKFQQGGSRFIAEAQRQGDTVKINAVQTTAVKISKTKYARSQGVTTTKGAKVLEAERPISLTTTTNKGTKTIQPLPIEQWQYKTVGRTTKTQQVTQLTSGLRKLPTIQPADAEKIITTKGPKVAAVTTQRRTSGVQTTRSFFDTKTPAVFTKTTTKQTIKGTTYAQAIPSKPVVKPTALKVARATGATARTIKTTTVKMLQSKKANIAEPRAGIYPETPTGLAPAAPKTKIITMLPELQQALQGASLAAAKLTYVYRPVSGGGALTAGLGSAGILSQAKAPQAIKTTPFVPAAGPAYKPISTVKPVSETQPKSSSYVIPLPSVTPTTKITVTPEITYKPATTTTPTTPEIGTPVIPPFIIPPFQPPIPGLPTSSLPFGGEWQSFSNVKMTTTRQAKGYTPSATALAFGITGKASKTGAKTGLGLRPIVIQKPKKKKYRF